MLAKLHHDKQSALGLAKPLAYLEKFKIALYLLESV